MCEPRDFVLEMEFSPFQFGELQIIGAKVGKGIFDFPLERPVLLFEIGQTSLNRHGGLPLFQDQTPNKEKSSHKTR